MIRIYEQDAYVFEFEGTVTDVDNEWISLNATAFYPGGGGQVSDRGRICGLEVTDVRISDGNIAHRVPGHGLKIGDNVWCSVDWERRYDLMIGHTAEHLLFGGLKRNVPDAEIVKIFISPESKYVIVDRDVEWSDVKKAQDFANDAVKSNLSVTKSTMEKDDPDVENVRAKLEKIDGDFLTVVEIGDADIAACSGIHVRETGEIGAVLVDRKVSAGKEGTAIHFRVGNDAVSRSMELADTCLRMVEILGTKPEDAVKAALNIRHDNDAKTKQLRSLLSGAVKNMRPEDINGTPVYSGIFETDDRTIMTDAAERIKERGGVAVLLAKGETLSVFLSSGVKAVDCSSVLRTAMAAAGGRGGGKPDFAQGGVGDVSKAAETMNALIGMVRDALKLR